MSLKIAKNLLRECKALEKNIIAVDPGSKYIGLALVMKIIYLNFSCILVVMKIKINIVKGIDDVCGHRRYKPSRD